MRPSMQPMHEPLTVDVLHDRHAAILGSRLLHWPDEAACASFAQALASRTELRDACIELSGPLGAGKTTFVRHLLHALGIAGRIKSPTYTVVEPYALPGLNISHFDFYRFNDAREWQDAGFRDIYASPGLKLAEWPEKATGMLPPPDLRLIITPIITPVSEPVITFVSEPAREVTVQACSTRGLALMA